MKVLCVDRDFFALRCMKREVPKIVPEAEVHYCRDPNKALAMAAEKGCDVLLTGIDMGASRNEGITLAQKIQASSGSFSMPAYPVTVSATFEGAPFAVTTVCDPTIGGTITVTGDGVSTTDGTTTAKAGTEVTLTVPPAAGFDVDTVKYNNTTIAASGSVYKFTMPTEAVTVIIRIPRCDGPS